MIGLDRLRFVGSDIVRTNNIPVLQLSHLMTLSGS